VKIQRFPGTPACRNPLFTAAPDPPYIRDRY
jgi:hypothetical protein